MATEPDRAVELYLAKRQIQQLTDARGNGTGMISLIIRPGEQLSGARKMLDVEYGTASNIKNRVNRLAVQETITAVQQKLKLYNRLPPNGLAVFCGNVMITENKSKLLKIDFQPYKPADRSLYKCDNKFHTESLESQLKIDEKFGFIVLGGGGALFATLCGTTREILHSFAVELPKKHGRGGQSALRFARLRLEKRHNYLRKVAELATKLFIENERPNVVGLILAGFADFKNDLNASDLFDPRLKAIVLKIVDISYEGLSGLDQAVNLSMDALSGVRYVKEKKIISTFFERIAENTNKYAIGIEETIQAWQMGAVDTIIIWEGIGATRITTHNIVTGVDDVRFLKKDQQINDKQVEITDSVPLVDWLAQNYNSYGAKLEIVSDVSEEGSQFARGFGCGGILKYEIPNLGDDLEQDEDPDEIDDLEEPL
jgi:peptide chain release factor subunit 1